MNAPRPIYETADDRTREQSVADYVGRLWDCSFRKNPTFYAADYSMMNGKLIGAFAEVKCRNYSMATLDSYGGLMLSLHKWAACRALCHTAGLQFWLFVSAGGAIYGHKTFSFDHDGVDFNGRSDRGDAQDREPVVLLRASRFKQLASP